MSWWYQVNQLHRNVWALGLTSFFNDIASEMIVTLLPIYMHSNLKTPHVAIGLIEGFSLAMSSICKILSGVLADRFSNNLRLLVGAGYFISAISRPIIALAHSYPLIAFLKFMDKAGKSIRGPGRDLMLGLSLHKSQRALAYGMHHMCETFGGVISLSIALYVLSRGSSDTLATSDYTTLVLLSLPFGLLAVASIIWIAREPEPVSEPQVGKKFGKIREVGLPATPHAEKTLISISDAQSPTPLPSPSALCSCDDDALHMHNQYLLGRYESNSVAIDGEDAPPQRSYGVFISLLLVVFLFQCFNPPSAFIPLLATEIGEMSIFHVTAMLLAHNAVYSLTIAPTGLLSDRLELRYQHGRALIISAAWCLRSILLYLLAHAETSTHIAAVWITYGVYMGLTESLMKVLIVDVLGDAKAGLATAFGSYNAVLGVGDVVAGVTAGALFDQGRQRLLYELCASISLLCAGLLLLWRGLIKPVDGHEWEDAPDWGRHIKVKDVEQNGSEQTIVRVLAHVEPLDSSEVLVSSDTIQYSHGCVEYVDVPLKLVTEALGTGPTPSNIEHFARNARKRAQGTYVEGDGPVVIVHFGAHERVVCVVGYDENTVYKRQHRRTRRGWEWAGRWRNVAHTKGEAMPLMG